MSNFLRFSGSNGNNGFSGNNGKNLDLNQDVLEIKHQYDLFAQASELSKQIMKDPSSYTQTLKEQDLIIQFKLANSIEEVKATFHPSGKPKPRKP